MLNGFQICGAEERSEKHVSQMIGCVGEYTADVNMMSAETWLVQVVAGDQKDIPYVYCGVPVRSRWQI